MVEVRERIFKKICVLKISLMLSERDDSNDLFVLVWLLDCWH